MLIEDMNNQQTNLFVEALKYNLSLRKLDLNVCQLEVQNFTEALKINHTLREISIYGRIPEELEHQREINRHPEKYPQEYQQKVINRLKFLRIEWKPQPEIHSLYPEAFQQQVKDILPLISYGRIPPELWIYGIIPQLGSLYLD